MTRDGLTEENLRDGSVKDISHRSRGRPENKEEFVPERERKKAGNEDSKSGKGKRLQMEKIRKSSVRQEAVEDTVEVTPEEKVSGYRKKLHRYEKIPDDDNNLNSQKKSIRKKQLQKQMTKEQAKAGRLSFDDEGNQMVKGAGMKPGGTAGKYIATQAVISGMKAVSSEEEETDENAGVESARLAERETEAALRGLRHAQIRSKRTDVKIHRRGYREATVEKKLKFGSAESMEGVKHAESVKNAEQKRHFYNRFFQKKRYKDAYRAARAGKSAGSLGGATTIAGVENMTVKAKIALKEIIKRNRAMFAGIGIFALLFLVIAVSLGSCSASIEGAGSVIGITTYPSSDEDIYAAENRYAALESALNQQINEMERRHPNYDEYQYNIAEIGHNPYHLISYLTAKYGDWTYSDVENELQSLFEAQYHLNTEGRTETVTETSLPAEMVRVRKGHPVMEQEETRTVRVITAVQEIIRAIIALQAVAALVRAITVLVQMADALRTAMDGRTIDSASRQQVKALQQKLRQRIRKSAETIAVLTSRSATRNREETRFTKKTAQQH